MTEATLRSIEDVRAVSAAQAYERDPGMWLDDICPSSFDDFDDDEPAEYRNRIILAERAAEEQAFNDRNRGQELLKSYRLASSQKAQAGCEHTIQDELLAYPLVSPQVLVPAGFIATSQMYQYVALATRTTPWGVARGKDAS